MTRIVVGIMVLLFGLAAASPARAQIKVIKKPAPQVGPDEEVVYDTWTSSWGLRDDPPNEYPLGIRTHKTEDEAVAAARAHIARTKGNGSLAVTHYLIEGEPTVRKKKAPDRVGQARDLYTRLKEAKAAVDRAKKIQKGQEPLLKAKERQLGDTVKEYKDMLRQSYRQAVEVKKTMVGGVAGLTEAKFREVNGLIDQYNRELQDYQSVMGKASASEFSPLERVKPFDPKQARAELVGTWSGPYKSTFGTTTLTLTFEADGQLSGRAASGKVRSGKWVRTGDAVELQWADGLEMTYRLAGTKLTGAGTGSMGESWSSTLTKK